MFSLNNLIKVLINTAIGVALVFVWLQFVNINDLLATLKTVKLEYALLFFVFFIFATCLRAARLKILLNSYKIPYFRILTLSFVSQFLSFIVPLRLGELTKGVYFSSKYDIHFAKALIWILIDRFLDFWVHFLLLGILIFIVPTKLPASFEPIIFSILIVFAAATILILKRPDLMSKLVNLLSKLLIFPKLQRFFTNTSATILGGFKVLDRHPAELLLLILVTTLAVFCDALIWFFVFYSFGINLGFLQNLLGSMLNTLTFLVPAAPGFVGSAEAAGLAVFSGILGINPNTASAATVLSHILAAIALPAAGIISLYFLDFDLKLVWKKLKK